jgi:hypothetical protein
MEKERFERRIQDDLNFEEFVYGWVKWYFATSNFGESDRLKTALGRVLDGGRLPPLGVPLVWRDGRRADRRAAQRRASAAAEAAGTAERVAGAVYRGAGQAEVALPSREMVRAMRGPNTASWGEVVAIAAQDRAGPPVRGVSRGDGRTPEYVSREGAGRGGAGRAGVSGEAAGRRDTGRGGARR